MSSPLNASPFVSVVITAYNHELFIAETVGSVIAQTYSHREIIVVDDGSKDRTADVLSAFGDAIRVIHQPNEGVAGSRNRGIRESRGDLVAFLDGDDRWHPEKLEHQVAAYQAHPDTGLVACDASLFEDATVITESLFDNTPARALLGTSAVVCGDMLAPLLEGNFIATTGQMMVPRKVFDSIGLSDPRFSIASDYDLYVRIAFGYPITLVNRALASWRFVRTSVSGHSAEIRRLRWAEDMIAVLRKHARSGPAKHRRACKAAVLRRSTEIARWAYYYSAHDRPYARRYLARLFWNSGSTTAGLYLLGLFSPDWLRAGVASTARRLLHDKTSA